MSSRTPAIELAVVLWGTLGVVAVLVDAIIRLLPNAIEPIATGTLDLPGSLAYVAAIVGMAYAEGYRGFQQRFSPRVVARAAGLARAPQPIWRLVLAPAITMGLIHATRRRLIATWMLVAMIVGLIVLVSLLDQPWRGAVDAGVVVGLSWGSATLLLELLAWLRGRTPTIDPDLPVG
ncbi:hypothetical protein ACNOYE_03565 [Nannocystaceae bacterium ST9]